MTYQRPDPISKFVKGKHFIWMILGVLGFHGYLMWGAVQVFLRNEPLQVGLFLAGFNIAMLSFWSWALVKFTRRTKYNDREALK